MPVTIAPSIRSKLRSITARDNFYSPSHDPRGMKSVTELLSSAATLRPSSGRFWDSDSDLEYEDLGDAEAHRLEEPSLPAVKHAVPAAVAPPPARSARPSPTPPCQPPWRSLWKGPLPPARVSPVATLGDFLPPSFLATGGVGSAARPATATDEDGSSDPVFAT
jgi:hypothetical protein